MIKTYRVSGGWERNKMLIRSVFIIASLTLDEVGASEPENAINGQRLFFTEAQRQQQTAEARSEQSAEALSGASPGFGKIDSEPAQATVAEHDAAAPGFVASTRLRTKSGVDASRAKLAGSDSSNQYQVDFTALVVGPRGAGVIVNGLPCRFDSDAWLSALQPLQMKCFGVKDESIALSILSRDKVLLVTDAMGRDHRLMPGERW